MALKDDWKKTGKGLGHAFSNLGKTIVRSAETTANQAVDWANGDEKKPEEAKTAPEGPEKAEGADGGKKSTVYNDGSWRKTGKELGHAFAGLGKTLGKTAKAGVDMVSDETDGKEETEGQ